MPILDDKEFGSVTIRRSAQSKSMKATVAPTGLLRISVPSYAPIFMVKRMIASSRPQLRKLLENRPKFILKDGMEIGKSHSLHVRISSNRSIMRSGQQIFLTLLENDSLVDEAIVNLVRAQALLILRKEAKHHLPRRLEYLADQFGFNFSSVRFTHASSRWGSCNNKKAISLNIALMNLPFELIDYVLIHELAHTKHLDHSSQFWSEVEQADPSFKLHRKQLKTHNPAI